jgi:hypothetical protein
MRIINISDLGDYSTPASPENIFVIENFMSLDDAQNLHELCDKSLEDPTSDEWWYGKFPGPEYTEYTFGRYREQCEKSTINYHDGKNPLLKEYMDKVVELVSFIGGRKVVPMFHFNRHKSEPGITCPGHTDSESQGPDGINYMLHDYSPNHVYEPSVIEFSANIYLNNNYEGGSLYFPGYDIKVEHTPGQLVFFPGTVEYVHAVETVSNKTRWNLISHLSRPKLITMHSTIHNMWHMLDSNQRMQFPENWEDEPRPRGVREGNVK